MNSKGIQPANQESEIDTINWNAINTDNISTNINLKHKLSNNANDLLERLKNFTITETEVNNTTNNNLTNNTTRNTIRNNKVNKFDDNTSPFITTEMYNELLNSTTSNYGPDLTQAGGAKRGKRTRKQKELCEDLKKNFHKIKEAIDRDKNNVNPRFQGEVDRTIDTYGFENQWDNFDDEEKQIIKDEYKKLFKSSKYNIYDGGNNNINDNSSTSSTSDSDTKKKKSKKGGSHKDDSESSVSTESSETTESTDSDESDSDSDSDLSYVSSSAHTDGDFSETEKKKKHNKSKKPQHKQNKATESVNTSDINMVDS